MRLLSDMIAIAGETFGDYPLKYMMNLMEESPEGTEILRYWLNLILKKKRFNINAFLNL